MAGSDASVTNSGSSSAAVLDFVIPRGLDGAPGADGAAGAMGAAGPAGPTGPPGPSIVEFDNGVYQYWRNASNISPIFREASSGANWVLEGTVSGSSWNTALSVAQSGVVTFPLGPVFSVPPNASNGIYFNGSYVDTNGNMQLAPGKYLRSASSATNTDDGKVGVGLFAAGLNLLGANSDGTYRKVAVWGEIRQQENPGTNVWMGANACIGAGQATAANFNTAGALAAAIELMDTGAGSQNGGAVVFSAASGAWKFAAIKGCVTNGSNYSLGDISFQVRKDANTSLLVEALRITAGGGVKFANSSAITFGNDWQNYNPAYGGSGSLTISGVSVFVSQYVRIGSVVHLDLAFQATLGGAGADLYVTVPLSLVGSGVAPFVANLAYTPMFCQFANASTLILKYAGGVNFPTGLQSISIKGTYRCG